MSLPDDSLERAAAARLPPGAAICGVDEVGRGPWAGPVCAAAAALRAPVEGLNDSKKLSAAKRQALEPLIKQNAIWSVVFVGVGEINHGSLGRACDAAMARAVAALPRADFALVDGRRVPPLPCPAEAHVQGDARSVSIAAASILAKEARDRVMIALAAECPGYGWETNMGYGVAAHAEALKRLGVTPYHRRNFRPIHNILTSSHFKNNP